MHFQQSLFYREELIHIKIYADLKFTSHLQAILSKNEATRGEKFSTCPLQVKRRLLSDDDATNSIRLEAYFSSFSITYSELRNSSPKLHKKK